MSTPAAIVLVLLAGGAVLLLLWIGRRQEAREKAAENRLREWLR